MKTWKSGWLVSILFLATGLVACQGKDPGRAYPEVKANANQPFNPGLGKQVVEPPPPPPGGTNQVACQKPLVTVVGNHFPDMLVFTEDKESTFEIDVRSQMGEDFKVAPGDMDPGLSSDFQAQRASFTLQKQSGSLASYSLTWHPGKVANTQKAFQLLKLNFSSSLSKICGDQVISLNLAVQTAPASTGDKK